ncbi:MAG: leucine--tRNA ligase [bacterium]|nr:leucine--tRNA ligase [bacterium]
MSDDRPYRPEEIEPRIQALWEKLGVFRTRDDLKDPNEKRLYCLDMFPYPSGEGLHVGHVEGYTATDIYSRYKRMRGFDVLHPMGWDAFGLPAENAAIKRKTHPRNLVEKNVARFTEQLKRLGFSYDWSREINTTDPEYTKWTQWIFLKLFHLGLAYEAVVPINWCPSCKTGLASEEVIDGRCERCGTTVTKKDLRQWMLRITKYADRLLHDLDQLDWPEGIKELQRNWIGRSEGTTVTFRIAEGVGSGVSGVGATIDVFTTRADTLFGTTYLVLSPEHPLVEKIVAPEQRDKVLSCMRASRAKTDLERTALEKEKTGVDTGARAVNPVNGEEIPIWVADYVLASYGTGAIMAVPAHDERDFAFAKKYNLLIKGVVIASEARQSRRGNREPHFAEATRGRQATGNREPAEAFVEDGVLVSSGDFSGLPSVEARERITAWLEGKTLGKESVHYKLRDWVFSRQRYWGEPIPIVHCETCGVVPVPEEQLPVLLPDVESYEPTGTGESPLAAIPDWVNTTCPKCGKPAKRETNTMPQWAGSCWYFLRFTEPQEQGTGTPLRQGFAGQGREQGTGTKTYAMPWSWDALERWMPVDLYVGGAEHAVLHLLYARFWMKALYDGGYVSIEEPFQKLRNQGIILGPDGQKMSKSRGNVVNPDEIVAQYGADTLRLYEMFLGPLEAGKPWNPKSIPGVHRFLKRVWRLGSAIINDSTSKSSESVQRALHRLIKKVGEDLEAFKFNTAIAAMMEFMNLVEKATGNRQQATGDDGGISIEDFRTFLVVLSPFAPHLAEELWSHFATGSAGQAPLRSPDFAGQATKSIMQERWPTYDSALIEEDIVQIVVQVDGKVRDQITVPRDLSDAEVRAVAEQRPKVQKWLAEKSVERVVVVPNRLVSFVIR